MLKKFSIWVLRNLIILLVVTLIFSSITLDLPSLLKSIFADIYSYASPEAQKQAISKLTESCSAFDNSDAVSIQQICSNNSILEQMKNNCNDYRDLKRKGYVIENELEMEESCLQIESGDIEKECDEMKKSYLQSDLSRIGVLCKEYKNGKISDREFFYLTLSSPLGEDMKMPQINLLEKYNKIVDALNKNKILYFVMFLILGLLLFLIIRDFTLFYSEIISIILSIGLLIMLPYFGILLYDKFVGIDTSYFLGSMFGLADLFDFKAAISLILLLFLRTYNDFIVSVGVVFLIGGIAGKIYLFALKRHKALEAKTEKQKRTKKK